MAEVNVLTAYLGRPENPRSTFYRVGLFVLALPALVVVASGLDPFKILVYSQVALSIQLPLTIAPLLLLASDKRVMGSSSAVPGNGSSASPRVRSSWRSTFSSSTS